MKIKFFLIFFTLLSSIYSQNIQVKTDSLCPNPSFKMGLGFGLQSISRVIYISSYSKGFGLDLGYGLGQSKGTDSYILQNKNSINAKFYITIASLRSDVSYDPIYLGIGYTKIYEKSRVLEFEGPGEINGLHYFIGYRFFTGKPLVNLNLGVNIEIGINKWNYNNSVLNKYGESSKYDYQKFYIGLGVTYYIF
jgi:hypothetical protein